MGRWHLPVAERRRALAWAAGGLGAVAVGALVAWSPLLAVRSIEVAGASHVSRDQVIDAAGIGSGTRTFLVDEAAIEDRLEDAPWVARATVETRLPSTVVIRIRERRPLAAIQELGGYALLAADGALLDHVDRPWSLPVIVSAPMQSGVAWATTAARALAEIEPRVRKMIERVIVEPGPEIVLGMHSGVVVEFGSPDDAEAKGEALGAVLRWADRNGVHVGVVDVRAPGSPAIHSESGKRLST